MQRVAANRLEPGALVRSRSMAQALVLNATYEPLSVVSARRAIVLLVREKAELIESKDFSFSSEKLSIPVPSVIRLLRYVRVPYRRRVPLNRRAGKTKIVDRAPPTTVAQGMVR